MTPRVVFDCMVFVQAIANEQGPAGALIERVRDGRLSLCVSHSILEELRGVLTRPSIRKKLPSITDERVRELLKIIADLAVRIDEVPGRFRLDRDPKDEMYVNLAIAAGAAYLVSRDRDLLDLMDTSESRAQFPSLTIIDPAGLLRLLTESIGPELPPSPSRGPGE